MQIHRNSADDKITDARIIHGRKQFAVGIHAVMLAEDNIAECEASIL